MNNKRGFTLIELIVSIVLVSVVLVSLIGTLLQIKTAYSVVHENSDIIVYTSSVSRILNSDINDHRGIRHVSCDSDGLKCSLLLGDDERRELILSGNRDESDYNGNENITKLNSKTTLKYYDTTVYDKTNTDSDKKLLYIRTLELDKYDNESSGVVTASGFNFYDMSATQYEYFSEETRDIDAFTTITIRMYDGLNLDLSKYDITVYSAGKYDYSKYIGKSYKIDLDNNGADTPGTTSIDELFGVGFFKAESAHNKSDMIESITIPTKEDMAFLGYYYKPNGINVEINVIDAGGNIVADSKLFKNDVVLNDLSTGIVEARWGECESGFYMDDGKCKQREYTVTLKSNCNGSESSSQYNINYLNKIPNIKDMSNISIPGCSGHQFLGYYHGRKAYHDSEGNGIGYYDIAYNSEFTALYSICSAGKFSSSGSCESCAKGSISSEDRNSCVVCKNGSTTSSNGVSTCDEICPNSDGVLLWVTPTWTNNRVNNSCKISSCKAGYTLNHNSCNPNTYKITLNNQNATQAGTAYINEKYNDGYYLINGSKMTPSSNPIVPPTKTNFDFGGYYTSTNISSGIKYIDENGNITSNANSTHFSNNSNLYAYWIDDTPPTMNVEFFTASGEKIESNYYQVSDNAITTQNVNSNVKWLSDYPTIKFTVSDVGSGINVSSNNDNQVIEYNDIYDGEFNPKLIGSFNKAYKEKTDNVYYYEAKILGAGNRYISFKICDKSNNCIKKYIHFKIDPDKPVLAFKGWGGENNNYIQFKCYSGVSGTASINSSDSVNGQSSSGSHYWRNYQTQNNPITATCTSNSGVSSSEMILEYYNSTSTATTSYSCCKRSTEYYGFNGGAFSTVNLCSSEEKEYGACGGIHKYQHCTGVSKSISSECKKTEKCVKYYNYQDSTCYNSYTKTNKYIKVTYEGIVEYILQ